MASKDSALKKRLIKEGILSVVALVALAAGGMLVSNYDDDAQAEKRLKENESSSLQAQHASIQQQLGSGMEVNAFYNIYIKNHSDDLMIKRETAAQSMAILREANHLTNLSLTIAPISEAKTDLVQLKSGNLMKSDVHLTFGGVSDNSVYGFIESLQRKLPGIVVVTDIKIDRKEDLSRDILVGVSQHRLTPLISSELSFLWLGIRPSDDDKSASTPSPNTPFPRGPGHAP